MECTGPNSIDGIVYTERSGDDRRLGHIEGYCENLAVGEVRVALSVGNCKGYGNSDAYTGFISVSRIVVEEVPKPQI